MKACFIWLKAFLALGIRNIGSPIAPERVKISHFLFFNFLKLDKSTTISSALPSILFPTSLLLSTLNIFGASNSDNPVIFNIQVSGIAILLKLQIKRR